MLQSNIISALSYYVGLGLPVIPICPADHRGMTKRHIESCHCAGKIPLIKGWQGWKETTDENVKEWIETWPKFNLGLPLGDASGYIGIDVDGEEGEKLLQEMSNGVLPETWEYQTGSGRRLLYQIPIGMKTKKFKRTGEGVHEECALLCSGQQTVLPPSVHHTGRTYIWYEGHSPEECDCALAPEWIITMIRREDNPTYHVPLAVSSPTSNLKTFLSLENIEEEFMEVEEDLLLTLPVDAEVKEAKKRNKGQVDYTVTPEELMSTITEGQRDTAMTRIVGHFCAKNRNLGKDHIMILAQGHNKSYCSPPLEESAIEAKVNHMWELEQMKSSAFKDLTDQKKNFEPMTMAQIVLNQWEDAGRVLKVQSDSDVIWMCQKDTGPWRDVNSRGTEFHGLFAHIVANPKFGDPKWTTRQKLTDIAHAILLLLRQQNRFWGADTGNIDTQGLTASDYIPLAGGQLLDWRTGEILPWDPETNFTYCLPCSYDPEAKCPYWEQKLVEWLPEKESRMLMQEFVGYSLIPYMGFEKALFLLGEGANGKSLFLESIQRMLGNNVVGSNSMKIIFSAFGKQYLKGKVINICNEAGSDYLKGGFADEFKDLVSGARQIANVKNQPHITFNNTAKFIFAANHDIRTQDKSLGWLRRLIIIPFNQDFSTSRVAKHEIMNNIGKENVGIFMWAIEGLRRLIAQNGFTESEEVNERQIKYLQQNDIASDFWNNCLVHSSGTLTEGKKMIRWGTPTALLCDLFKSWIDYKESSVQKPARALNDLMEKKRVLKERTTHVKHSNSKQTMCWIGISLDITDSEFLEVLESEGTQIVREYAMKRLKELDTSAS